MGAWGPGIFANDTAADARDEWREALIAGDDPRAASERIVARSGSDDDTDFWTGLAAAQHETGHLQDDVRERALAIIAAGGDLELWDENAGARARALERLAAKLRGPQPAPKKLRGPRPGPDPGVEIGDVLRVWSEDRKRSALFMVAAITEFERSRWPVVLGLGTETDEAPLLLTCMVDRPGDEFGPEIGEIVARGVTPPPLPSDFDDWSDHGSFASLVAEVEAIETRGRLRGADDEAREDLERGSAMMQRFWLEGLRQQHEQVLSMDADDLSPREAALLRELQEAAAAMLADWDSDEDDDEDDVS
jgi:hypothetical protein